VTQAQLERAVASATGETIRDVRSRGFSILAQRTESPDPDHNCPANALGIRHNIID
jgi:hypothetical protein